MGVDIHGWVEMKAWYPDEWIGVMRIDAVIGRHKDGFGSMFLNEGLFEPISVGRGLPEDISEEVKRSHPEDNWGYTWSFWREIAAIDWDAFYTPKSPSIYKYTRRASGDMLLEWCKYLHELNDPPLLDFTKDGEVEIGDTRYRIVHDPPIQRREVLHAGWPLVFNTMQFIADQRRRGDENVRLVVWFNG
jgi:hypothetical protein